MDRPTKVEAGQRWRTDMGGYEFTILPGMERSSEGLTVGATFLGWRDGYGPNAPEQLAYTKQMCKEIDARNKRASAPRPQHIGAPVGEMFDASTRAPLSALESIRSRKAPEPWRPSVDDWDLLPDV